VHEVVQLGSFPHLFERFRRRSHAVRAKRAQTGG
jgi:hypothetical protein